MNYIENPSPYNQTVIYEVVTTRAAHPNNLTCTARNASQRNAYGPPIQKKLNTMTWLKSSKEMRQGPIFSSSLI